MNEPMFSLRSTAAGGPRRVFAVPGEPRAGEEVTAEVRINQTRTLRAVRAQTT